MITLADYLDYLNGELLKARRRADETAIAIAKEYAQHEYLQHFRAPRFTMPTIKMKLPIRIDAVDQETRYAFHFRAQEFVNGLNQQFAAAARRFGVKLPLIPVELVEQDRFRAVLEKIGRLDFGFVSEIEHAIPLQYGEALFEIIVAHLKQQLEALRNIPFVGRNLAFELSDPLLEALQTILQQQLVRQLRPEATNLDRMTVTPRAGSQSTEETDQLLLLLDIEMVEEGLKVTRMTDKDGNVVEEISVD